MGISQVLTSHLCGRSHQVFASSHMHLSCVLPTYSLAHDRSDLVCAGSFTVARRGCARLLGTPLFYTNAAMPSVMRVDGVAA